MVHESHYPNQAAFTLLAHGKPRWRSFGSALGIEIILLLLLVWIPVLLPQKFEAVTRHYWVTPVPAPPVVEWKPQPLKLKPLPVKQPEIAKELPPKPEELTVPPKPKIYAPVFSTPVTHPSAVKRNKPEEQAPTVAANYPDNKPLSMGSSAIPTLRKPREAVQTGGFGDPNGVPANGQVNRNPNITQLGSYDLPSGPGYGNGTGGAKGARGIVASSGFGNGVAVGGRGSSGSGNGKVTQGLFTNQATTEGPKVKTTAASKPKTEPVEILFKPKPVYTEEARRQHVEGEVLVQVAFSASGQLQVIRVMKGLGYGLDESAIEAARQIRFRPALQDGQPVDSLATVHILFELAY